MRVVLAFLVALLVVSQATAADVKPIKVAVGDEFEILLESPAGANRQWLLAKPLDEGLLKSSGREYRHKPGPNSQRRTFELLRYKAVSRGQTEIHLKFASLFDKDEASLQKTNFVVVISQSVAKK